MVSYLQGKYTFRHAIPQSGECVVQLLLRSYYE